MAVPAQFSLVGNGLELMLSFLFVAKCAVTGGDRSVDEFVLSYAAVASVVDTDRFLFRGACCDGSCASSPGVKKEEKSR